jgi:putative FmdB family regulatory protein
VPTYQYSCTECGHFFEQVQSFSDDALTTCPECAGRLRKVFNAVGVVFKGSGFYRTDSRTGTGNDNGSTAGAGKDAGGNGDTGAAAKTSTDSGSTSGSAGGSGAGSSSSGSSGEKSASSGSAA